MIESQMPCSESNSGKPMITRVNPSSSKWSWFQLFMEETFRHLPNPTASAVWLALLSEAVGSTAAVNQVRLSDITGLSVRTVKRAINDLKRLGLIQVVQKGDSFTGRPNHYRLRPTFPPTPEEMKRMWRMRHLGATDGTLNTKDSPHSRAAKPSEGTNGVAPLPCEPPF
jgi:hypothetical protein